MTTNLDMREIVQKKAVETFFDNNGVGILQIAMRVGKTRVGVNIIEDRLFFSLKLPAILVLYPDNRIKDSWIAEIEKCNMPHLLDFITFSNYASIDKQISTNWDLVIFDEVHATSDRQKDYMQELIDNTQYVLGLTGTLSTDSEKELTEMGLPVLMKYSTEDAIKDGIIAPYNIFIHYVELDTVRKEKNKKGKWLSEKQRYNNYTYVIEEMKEKGQDVGFLLLHRNRILQGSHAKLIKTLQLIKEHKGERFLVFTGLKKIAESLGIPYYHSTVKTEEEYTKFKNGEINEMALVNMARLGVTFKGLDTLIINSFVGNEETVEQMISRCLNKDTNDKVGKIHIICSIEEAEQKKLWRVLAGYDKDEIVIIRKK